jgi:transcriptional regulator NrdR family protein
VKMNCPTCHNELSKKWQPPQNTKSPLAPRGQWSCGVCGGNFTRLEIQAAGKPVVVAASAGATTVATALISSDLQKAIPGDEDEIDEAQVQVLA